MFFTQVVIPVLIMAGINFWAGTRFEKIRHEAEHKRKVLRRLPKNFDWRI
jgi:hypothetical protein